MSAPPGNRAEARRLPSDLVVLALVIAALELATSTWRALDQRSLLPLRLDHVVVGRDTRFEKHPGKDDRWFVVLEPAGGGPREEREVTRSAHDALPPRARVEKAEDERRMRVDGQVVPLARDPLAKGLLVALVLSLAPALAVLAARLSRPPAE